MGLLCFAAFPKPGADVEVVVSSVISTHCLVRGPGWTGTVHFTELSWSHVEKAGDVCSVDQRLRARVLRVKGERVILSVKALQPDPWTTVRDRYPVGATVRGRVRRVEPFGAFVELEPGIDGLVHVSRMVLDRRL